MSEVYLHGIETIEQNNGPKSGVFINTGIIHVVGTAPDANAEDWAYNRPRMMLGLDGIAPGLGETGTLLDSLTAIFAQSTQKASPMVIVTRVESDDDVLMQMTKVIGSLFAKTGIYAALRCESDLGEKPRILIAPGFTSHMPTDGIASAALTAGGENFTEPPTVTITGDGTGAEAAAVINSETGQVTDVYMTKHGRGYTNATITLTGGGGTGAEATVTLGKVNNPVTQELLIVARRLRAGVIVDGPNTTPEDAVAYRYGFDTDRPMLIVDPYVKVLKNGTLVAQPTSAFAAGRQSVLDYEKGFWHTVSNKVLEKVVGVARPMEFSNDPSSEVQYLNSHAVSVVTKKPSGGYKFYGSRNATSNSLDAFWSVRRAHDVMIDTVELVCEPFIDEPISANILEDISETVNGNLRRWEAKGATLGGKVWLDPKLNTKEEWQQGRIYISWDAEAPAPIERMTFLFHRNLGYYERLRDQAASGVATAA
ncbi:hypothetical protein GCM10007094_23990 [Pseudovibrio japonicus]|uniref:Phage tail protein n=1 Tax=Pseudovibrio japonicus TaxID=366534 RepID=A0ABQ3EEV0_9HYPH|nr:phage tail sheath subtilisin-like domain-containing protein [Pseudovibrio japonicus]GHB34125.1 hypothetical protein GCM10007094_23990 [Pseudovibrio japonicus]